jgi:hypothetical protein
MDIDFDNIENSPQEPEVQMVEEPVQLKELKKNPMKKWHQPAKKPENAATKTRSKKAEQDDSFLSEQAEDRDNIG